MSIWNVICVLLDRWRKIRNLRKQLSMTRKCTKELDHLFAAIGLDLASFELRPLPAEREGLYDILANEILKSESSEEEKTTSLARLRTFCDTDTNIMLVGATGCGKSSTINALFAYGNETTEVADSDSEDGEDVIVARPRYDEVAKVGSKAAPETKGVEKYHIGNLVLWDTPGLGNGTEIDEHNKKVITELLREEDSVGNALIDLVLVILDGSTRDPRISYRILNDVIIPELKDDTDRILIALNQTDIAMKTGGHWDYEKNEPDETLINFLNEKVESIKARIKENSALDVNPVYYCAGYEEESGEIVHPYNLSKLLSYIMESLPAQKRVSIMNRIDTDSNN